MTRRTKGQRQPLIPVPEFTCLDEYAPSPLDANSSTKETSTASSTLGEQDDLFANFSLTGDLFEGEE